jgi:chromate transporter
MASSPGRPTLLQVMGVFGLLGLVAFGGPAAHVALMRREVVEKRRWLPADEFNRMFAACNLIPGPSSTELALFIGYRLAGWRALAATGLLFILPAMLLMLLLAWVYTAFGESRPALAVLYGIRPVIVGILIWAVYDLATRLVRQRQLLALSLVAAALLLLNVNPILVLLGGGLVAAAATRIRSGRPGGVGAVLLAGAGLRADELGRLPVLFLTFLKIGAVSFGSGYVLLPLLRTDFVAGLHWLSDRQLLDAVALGQATPGPVFTTATFLGYLFAGVPGAILATIAIFLPAFVLVPVLDRIVALVESRAWTRSFVDGANAAAVGLIAGATILLGRSAALDVLAIVLMLGTVVLLFRWPLASPAAIAAGAVAGLVRLFGT